MFAWIIFAAIVTALFVTDLFLKRGALVRVLTYVAIAIGFGAWVWMDRGADDGMKFFTAYALEMSLSLDNVFIISLIFGALAIPPQYRERVLIYGILGALVFRGIFIGFGTVLVGAFDWLLIIAGLFLIYTGAKLVLSHDEPDEIDLDKNRVFKFLKRIMPVTNEIHGTKLFVRRWGKDGVEKFTLYATPLFVALIMVEIADVIFAADSVPATFAVTTDPFLVYTSNIFAILGLRALYSVLENAVNAFEHLGKAVAVVLVLIGLKVVAAHTIHFHIPNAVSLAIVIGTLALGVIASLVTRKPDAQKSEA